MVCAHPGVIAALAPSALITLVGVHSFRPICPIKERLQHLPSVLTILKRPGALAQCAHGEFCAHPGVIAALAPNALITLWSTCPKVSRLGEGLIDHHRYHDK